MPGADSTPDDTSTAYGRDRRDRAPATLSAFSPPDRMTGRVPRDRRGDRPVDRPPGPAALDRIVRVEQHGDVGRERRATACDAKSSPSTGDRLDHAACSARDSSPASRRRGAAPRRAPTLAAIARDVVRRLIDEHADGRHERRQRRDDRARLRQARRSAGCPARRRSRSRRRRAPPRARASSSRRDAADLDPVMRALPPRSSRSAAPGSGCAISRSPTRNAS